MIFRQFRNPETSSFTYVLGDLTRKQAIVIDPTPAHVERDLAFLGHFGLDLLYVLLTHGDPEHDEAARAIRARTGAKIACRNGSTTDADLSIRGGNALPFGTDPVRVLDTPGSTKDGVSYLVGKRVFTGNALSVRGCGWDQAGSDPGKLYDSIVDVLFALPDETLVYPAHHAGGVTATTIGAERRFNPDVANRDRASFLARCGTRGRLPLRASSGANA